MFAKLRRNFTLRINEARYDELDQLRDRLKSGNTDKKVQKAVQDQILDKVAPALQTKDMKLK